MKKIVLAILLAGLMQKASASHIVGGEVMYQYLSTSNGFKNYRVTMYLYIDCVNGNLDAIASDYESFFNVFRMSNQSLQTNLCKTVTRTGPVTVSDLNYKCIKNKPNACVDKYTYTTTMSLPINTRYLISFERCCRNKTINNIVSPESTGATYFTEINTALNNNSPSFKYLPPNFLCTNAPLKFDHSAVDADGDSLVYELFQPFDGAGTSPSTASRPDYSDPSNLPHYPSNLILWESGFNTYGNQINGSPTLTIDRRTGKLTLTPNIMGQYVIGIKVKEYRKGVLIGETKRDFQFNVADCNFDVVSSFFVPQKNCAGNPITFNNRSQGGIRYSWNFGDSNTLADTSNLKNPSYTYKIPGTYTITLVTSSSVCIDTSDYEITVIPNFVVKLPKDTLVCGNFSKLLSSNLSNSPGKTFQWSTGQNSKTITVNKGGLYWLSVSETPCISGDSIFITNDLEKLNLGPDSVICRDSFVQFTYPGKPGYKTYLWNDGSKKDSVFIPQLGTYWVSITNKNDCPSTDTITFVLYPPPRIRLFDTLFCKGTSVVLDGVNYSVKTKLETNYLWNTGDTSSKITTFKPGRYIIKVRNRLCTVFDTAVLTHIETGLDLGVDTFYCGPVDRWLYPQKGFVKYQWHDFAETINYHAVTPGKKKLTITTKEGCIESDSVLITQFPVRDGGLGNDTAICLSSSLSLTASDSMINYLWNTGETTRKIRISSGGTYTVTFKYGIGCINADSIKITEAGDALPNEMFMPNAFSPNDDNLNEVYPGNKYADPGSAYMLRIYNRWGEKIFESNTPQIGWDGKFKEEQVPQDVYVFYVKYVGCDDKERWFRGTFTLIR